VERVTTKSFRVSRMLILSRRLFHMVDNELFQRSFARLKFEAEGRDGIKDRCSTARIGGRGHGRSAFATAGGFRPGADRGHQFGQGEIELQVIASFSPVISTTLRAPELPTRANCESRSAKPAMVNWLASICITMVA